MELYRGWIPAVAGRLSFQKIGKAYNNGKAYRSHINIDGSLFIVAWAERYTGDMEIPFLPNNRFFRNLFHGMRKNVGHHIFITVLESEKQKQDNNTNTLKGSIFILQPNNFYKSPQQAHAVRPDLKSTYDLIAENCGERDIDNFSVDKMLRKFATATEILGQNIYCEAHPEPYRFQAVDANIAKYFQDQLEKSHAEITQFIKKQSLAYADITLEKDGLLVLSASDERIFEDSFYGSDETTGKHRLSSSTIPNDHKKYKSITEYRRNIRRHRIIDQFFYAIRDFSHVHHHHTPKSDNFSYTYHVSDLNDRSWIWKIISDFHRRLLSLRRHDAFHQYQAAGYAAYGKTLEAIIEKRFAGEIAKISPPYLRDYQIQSLESSAQNNHLLNELVTWKLQKYISIATAVAAAILAISISTLPISVKSVSQDGETVSVKNFLTTHGLNGFFPDALIDTIDVVHKVLQSPITPLMIITYILVYLWLKKSDIGSWIGRNTRIMTNIASTLFKNKLASTLSLLTMSFLFFFLFIKAMGQIFK